MNDGRSKARPKLIADHKGDVYEQTYNRYGKPAGLRRKRITPEQREQILAARKETR